MIKIILLSLFLNLISHDRDINVINIIPNDIIETTIKVSSDLLDVDDTLIFVLPIKDSVAATFAKKHNKQLSGFIIPGNNVFSIYIDASLTGDQLMEVICHEMIHLKQIQSGDLKLTKEYHFIWKGRFKHKNTPYNERYWEKEAYNRQGSLFRRVKNMINNQ